ncbi:hypothetical protein FRC06_008776 [Ceratobasidium sp. 370]|nr:hypothetical protein FRC06_008776 [Ceratobasidium sp. 370]
MAAPKPLELVVLPAGPDRDEETLTRFWALVASVPKLTVVCGAGVSTGSGIPDFRSPDGLYNRVFEVGGNMFKGRDMFDLDVLKSQRTVKWLNQVMTKLRQQARSAPLTHFHRFIIQAFESGRLLRCYTQNFDGLQTREHPEVKARVFEVHGTNYELICRTCNRHPTRPVHEYDDVFLRVGTVACPWCHENADKARQAQKRVRAIGHLIPNILFNGDTTHPLLDQYDLTEMQAADSHAPLLLVVGTSMKVRGIEGIVRTLAKGVHDRGGSVMYVDRSDLTSSWRTVFDLHVKGDIEEFFQGLMGHAQKRWAKPRLLREVFNPVTLVSVF